ncbi:MAG: nucleotidyltransferase domain-containing protein [Nanoarchaeota archaeon]|nr:nucleotidyltransferase domain-containing protein [Nanoarchaeota archaeon]MBU2475718.1 nucleotidyltransferase domain-containing protein [Nanoarchaeota archaeon]
MTREFWKDWKRKTIIEKKAIKRIIKARGLIIKSIPKNKLIAIYIKGSFVRREMNKNSDIDIVPIVTEIKYEGRVFEVNSHNVYPCIVVPLSIEEFKKNKLMTQANHKPDLRAKPDRFLKKLKECGLIYGNGLNPKKFPIRSNEKALKDEIKLMGEGYIKLYRKKEIKFAPLLKQVFWLTETELEHKKKKVSHTWKGLDKAIKEKSHIMHLAYKYRLNKPKDKKRRDAFVKKLEKHLNKLEKIF